MKKLFIILFALTSNLTFASYHGGTGGTDENPSSGGGGGYGGGSSGAAALVGVGLVAYFVLNRGDDETEEFANINEEQRFKVDFLRDETNFSSFSENSQFENDFQINFKYYVN